jgi:hypothetical protein
LRRIAPLAVVLRAALQCVAQTAFAPAPPATTTTTSTSVASPERQITWKLLVPNVIHDQKPIWLFSKAVAEGKHVTPTIVVLSVTGGLIALDPMGPPYSRRTQSLDGFNTDFSARNTSIAMAALPSAFYVCGLARKDSYASNKNRSFQR